MNAYDGTTAVVIGGSIGGLTTALLLRDLGFTVDVFERTPTALDGRGSGIVLQPDTLRWFTERSDQHPENLSTTTDWVQYLDIDNRLVHRERRTWSYTSWGTFYRALLSDFGHDHYHLGEYACGFHQDDRSVTVRFVSGREVTADLVVFADGITSIGRRRLDPAADLTYSGYIGWRGTVPEKDLSETTRELLKDSITYTVVPHSHITLYPIPGEGGTGPQDRLMNYVWYRNVPAGPELSEMLIDKRGFPGTVSIHPSQVQDRYVAEMRDAARRMLSSAAAEVVTSTATPYIQVVSDARASRMADGRVALIGDAACAARPHAAAGTAKAAADAWALVAALRETEGDISAALRKWEPVQLELSARLLERVVAMGERSQFSNTWTPGDPSLRFGLYGPGR
ncbi:MULTISPECIES: FAD binding domain-containing protein [Streptomyces]|uniref:FAD binding domain-containing protein n=1 Tax=Streptomyces TaxID=1883 RepID=UPI000F76B986|nr:FAD binding domain-containing protein [Streptomyces sp. WAC05858]RSS40085.1 monooxygenase [Streptomyces sp. WAC05858]WTA80152.1 FAD binding domain-containing protein [Streptomyces antimycoticus]